MKNYVFALPFLFFFHFSFAQTGVDLFDDSFIHTIEIEFYEPNFWDTLEFNYNLIHDGMGLPTGPKIYLPAKITIDGVVLDTVGVRQKGFFSNWGAFGSTKKPLKVDINEFVKGQKYDGLKKFNLNNSFEDPSHMRDMLSLNLMREAGLVAPRTSYAKVFLNGTHWGIYVIIEQVDKTFLKENFSNGNGNLYKSIAASDLQWTSSNFLDYTDEVELKTNETENDWSDFIHFLDIVNNRPVADSILKVFDVEDFLKVLSIDVLLYNWDSYYDHGRNWYIYHNPDDGKFHWIPWDYNLAVSGNTTDILFQDNGGITHKPLIHNILQIDSFQTHYLNSYCEQLRDNFSITRLFPLIDSARDVIRLDLAFSGNEFFTISQFDQSLNVDIMGGFGTYKGLKNFINERSNHVNNELLNLGHVCPPATAIDDLILDNKALLIYPNPASTQLTLEMKNATLQGGYEIKIYDAMGREVAYYPTFIQSATIPIQEFSDGLYTISLTNKTKRATRRFVVRH